MTTTAVTIPTSGEAVERTLVDAVNLALAEEMERDPEVVVLGEDVGVNGGVFRATAGLLERFGPRRVLDTPLAEAMIAGMSVGMAAQGLKPVAEFQFMGFIYPAMEQIVSHASRLRNRTRGRLACPLVLRAPYGAGIHAPEHHSESTEALFAHIPGLRVVIPSTPTRAYGLLLAAIREPDPVLFLEPKRLYRQVTQRFEANGMALPLDTCLTARVGTDVTLIGWGAACHETERAALMLEQRGISAEVIDVATVKPLDLETILRSVRKTGRCVIVHEAPVSFGGGAEIAATIAERAPEALRAPVQRVGAPDIVVPYHRAERLYMPDVADVVTAVLRCFAAGGEVA